MYYLEEDVVAIRYVRPRWPITPQRQHTHHIYTHRLNQAKYNNQCAKKKKNKNDDKQQSLRMNDVLYVC